MAGLFKFEMIMIAKQYHGREMYIEDGGFYCCLFLGKKVDMKEKLIREDFYRI